jgi:hypothetical protein
MICDAIFNATADRICQFGAFSSKPNPVIELQDEAQNGSLKCCPQLSCKASTKRSHSPRAESSPETDGHLIGLEERLPILLSSGETADTSCWRHLPSNYPWNKTYNAIPKPHCSTAKARSYSSIHSPLFLVLSFRSLDFLHARFPHAYSLVLSVVTLFDDYVAMPKCLAHPHFHFLMDAFVITCAMWTSFVCVRKPVGIVASTLTCKPARQSLQSDQSCYLCGQCACSLNSGRI